MTEIPSDFPQWGELVAVTGSPGPGRDMRFDVSALVGYGTIVFEGVENELPSPEDLNPPMFYDMVAPPLGTRVWISWLGNEPKFCVPWVAKASPCSQPLTGGARMMRLPDGTIVRVTDPPPGGGTLAPSGLPPPSAEP